MSIITNGFIAEVKELMGDGYEVTTQEVLKGNGVKKVGLTIRKEGEKVAPTIYVDDWEEEDQTPRKVVKCYHDNAGTTNDMIASVVGENGELRFDHDYVIANVYPALVNRDRNAERLTELVHDPYDDTDLDIVYRVKVNVTGQDASFLMKNDHCSSMGVDRSELKDAALSNIQGKCQVQSLFQMLTGMLGEDEMLGGEADMPIQVISNYRKSYGASAILDKMVVEKLNAMFGDEFVILPSSVHEMLVLPNSEDGPSFDELSGMVREVNATQVADVDFLSDNVYVYKNGKVGVA